MFIKENAVLLKFNVIMWKLFKKKLYIESKSMSKYLKMNAIIEEVGFLIKNC